MTSLTRQFGLDELTLLPPPSRRKYPQIVRHRVKRCPDCGGAMGRLGVVCEIEDKVLLACPHQGCDYSLVLFWI